MGPHHGQNRYGSCSAVSVQLLLGFHNYYNDRRIIEDKYLFEEENNPNKCINPMTINEYIISTRGLSEGIKPNDEEEIMAQDLKEGTTNENSYFLKILNLIPVSSGNSTQTNGLNQLLEERRIEKGLNESLATVTSSEELYEIKREIEHHFLLILLAH